MAMSSTNDPDRTRIGSAAPGTPGGGPLFPQWRAIVGPFFAQPPVVEHFVLVGKSD